MKKEINGSLLAGDIIEVFCDFLEEKAIIIPNDDRSDGDPPIFSYDYTDLKLKLTELLENYDIY